MFLVFNKEKINSYVLLVGMIVILFGLALSMKEKNAIETSVNVEQTQNIQKRNELVNDVDILID